MTAFLAALLDSTSHIRPLIRNIRRTRCITSARNDDVPGFRIPSRTYHDLFFRHDFGTGHLDGLRLGFGIENLTDRDPPIVPGGPANTDPQQYDILGRRYFVRLSYRF